MTLLPPSTNAAYSGSPLAAHFLTLLGVLTLGPGLIHSFLPDGGSGSIAGLDLSRNGHQIIGLFAWVGATQIAWGSALLAISLRYRTLVPLALALVLVEHTLITANLWVGKAAYAGHHPPAAYGNLVIVPLTAVALALSLRRGPAGPATNFQPEGTNARARPRPGGRA